jgi:TRAP transporter TAXI family solute receptor
MRMIRLAALAGAFCIACLSMAWARDGDLVAAYADGAGVPIAAALAELANAKTPSLALGFSRVANSSDALDRLGRGAAVAALVNGHSAHLYYAGAGPYEGAARRDLRSVAALLPFATHVLIRRPLLSDGSLSDLAGLPGLFAIGRRRTDGYRTAADLFSALGLRPVGDGVTFDPEPVAIRSLVRGDVDGVQVTGIVPAAAAVQALDRLGSEAVALLGLDAAELDRLDRRFPGVWFALRAGREAYPALPRAVAVPAVSLILAVRADAPAALVRGLLDALYGDGASLRGIHPAAGQIALATALRGLSAPLHPAAAWYFAGRGVSVPSRLRP